MELIILYDNFFVFSAVIHPFAEHIAYFKLFSVPMLTAILTDTASIASIAGYLTYIDYEQYGSLQS